jgi:monoamine oxidase
MPDADVIILGAGLAGLAAAHDLMDASVDVVVIEARDRLGGRVWTRHDGDLDYPIELGPEWFDAAGPMHRLLERSGARVHGATGPFLQRTARGLNASDEVADGGDELHRRLRSITGPDRSLKDALDSCCGATEFVNARAMLLGYVEGFHAADPNRVSLRWFTETEQTQPADDAQYRSQDGVDAVVEILSTGLAAERTVQLRSSARAIRWRPGAVEVDVERDEAIATRSARAVIVTLPLPVLASAPGEPGGVKFVPDIEGKRAAMTGLAMGSVLKTVLTFDEPFWLGRGVLGEMLFVQDRRQTLPTWWTTQPVEAPVLTGWLAGPAASRFGSPSRDALLDVALGSLAGALDVPRATIERHLRSWHWHDWQRDPWSRGAYSWVVAGGADSCRLLGEPVSDTLFFAGEATAGHGLNATMDGAIASGNRAAAEVIAALRA